MKPAVIRRLMQRHGLTARQARLIAALHFGVKHD
jgi:hypothetical protein